MDFKFNRRIEDDIEKSARTIIIPTCSDIENYMQELDCNLENFDYLQDYGQTKFDTDEEWFDYYTDYYNDICSDKVSNFSIPDCELSLNRCVKNPELPECTKGITSFSVNPFSLNSTSNAVLNPFLIILLLLALFIRH